MMQKSWIGVLKLHNIATEVQAGDSLSSALNDWQQLTGWTDWLKSGSSSSLRCSGS